MHPAMTYMLLGHPFMRGGRYEVLRHGLGSNAGSKSITDEKAISKLPPKVRAALNILRPKKLRLAERAISAYLETIIKEVDSAYKKEQDLSDAIRKFQRELFKSVCGSENFNSDYSSKDPSNPHLRVVRYSKFGSLTEELTKKLSVRNDPRSKSSVEEKQNQYHSILDEIRKMNGFPDGTSVSVDSNSWSAYGLEMTIDLSKNKDYMALNKKYERAKKMYEQIRNTQAELERATGFGW